MIFERVTDARHELFSAAMELYHSSFPEHERRLAPSQKRILSDPEYNFMLIYSGDTFVGLMLYWENDDFIYLEHFCTLPEMRGKGLGAKALKKLVSGGKTVILEIDPPENEISRRRRAFYERCGFLCNGYDYIHLPYRPEDAGHRLVIMSSPAAVDEARFEAFRDYMRSRVMLSAME